MKKNTALFEEYSSLLGIEFRGLLRAQELNSVTQERMRRWLNKGHAGDMAYLEKGEAVMGDLRSWKSWTRSVALFAMPYSRPARTFHKGGAVARYALGRDYHNLFGKRLERLGKRLQREGVLKQFRAVTDAAPVMEREWAFLGRAGFRGKNTLLIDPQRGPWLILGELLMDLEWVDDSASTPKALPNCGTCTACLDACPTQAFEQPYELDARKCISYLTIEQKKGIPLEHRDKMGEHVFGCDVCLDVCPFGSQASDTSSTWGTHEAILNHSLIDLFELSEEAFQEAFLGSPLRRAGHLGMMRNACIALGNRWKNVPPPKHELELIEKVAREHPSEMLREHARWAIAQTETTNQ